jgi:PD-(D/E)XK nuclease superfamily
MCAALEAQVWDPCNVYGVEQTIDYVWHDEAMVVAFEGVLDLVTMDAAAASATINDLKTGWAVESQVELFQQLQAQVYALLLLRKLPGLKRIRFQQIQFRRGGRAVAARHPIDGRDYYLAEDLDEVERSLRQEVAKILRDSDFTANPACVTCPVGTHDMPALEYCKTITVGVANGYLEIPGLTTPRTEDQARRLALVAHVSHRIEAAARDAVRGWCADHGPLPISPDEALGHWERSERSCRDIPAALDLLSRNGYDLDRYVRLNTQELKSLIDPQSRRYLPELGALIDVKVASSYGFRKYRLEDRSGPLEEAAPEMSSTGGPTLTVIEGGLQGGSHDAER